MSTLSIPESCFKLAKDSDVFTYNYRAADHDTDSVSLKKHVYYADLDYSVSFFVTDNICIEYESGEVITGVIISIVGNYITVVTESGPMVFDTRKFRSLYGLYVKNIRHYQDKRDYVDLVKVHGDDPDDQESYVLFNNDNISAKLRVNDVVKVDFIYNHLDIRTGALERREVSVTGILSVTNYRSLSGDNIGYDVICVQTMGFNSHYKQSSLFESSKVSLNNHYIRVCDIVHISHLAVKQGGL